MSMIEVTKTSDDSFSKRNSPAFGMELSPLSNNTQPSPKDSGVDVSSPSHRDEDAMFGSPAIPSASSVNTSSIVSSNVSSAKNMLTTAKCVASSGVSLVHNSIISSSVVTTSTPLTKTTVASTTKSKFYSHKRKINKNEIQAKEFRKMIVLDDKEKKQLASKKLNNVTKKMTSVMNNKKMNLDKKVEETSTKDSEESNIKVKKKKGSEPEKYSINAVEERKLGIVIRMSKSKPITNGDIKCNRKDSTTKADSRVVAHTTSANVALTNVNVLNVEAPNNTAYEGALKVLRKRKTTMSKKDAPVKKITRKNKHPFVKSNEASTTLCGHPSPSFPLLTSQNNVYNTCGASPKMPQLNIETSNISSFFHQPPINSNPCASPLFLFSGANSMDVLPNIILPTKLTCKIGNKVITKLLSSSSMPSSDSPCNLSTSPYNSIPTPHSPSFCSLTMPPFSSNFSAHQSFKTPSSFHQFSTTTTPIIHSSSVSHTNPLSEAPPYNSTFSQLSFKQQNYTNPFPTIYGSITTQNNNTSVCNIVEKKKIKKKKVKTFMKVETMSPLKIKLFKNSQQQALADVTMTETTPDVVAAEASLTMSQSIFTTSSSIISHHIFITTSTTTVITPFSTTPSTLTCQLTPPTSISSLKHQINCDSKKVKNKRVVHKRHKMTKEKRVVMPDGQTKKLKLVLPSQFLNSQPLHLDHSQPPKQQTLHRTLATCQLKGDVVKDLCSPPSHFQATQQHYNEEQQKLLFQQQQHYNYIQQQKLQAKQQNDKATDSIKPNVAITTLNENQCSNDQTHKQNSHQTNYHSNQNGAYDNAKCNSISSPSKPLMYSQPVCLTSCNKQDHLNNTPHDTNNNINNTYNNNNKTNNNNNRGWINFSIESICSNEKFPIRSNILAPFNNNNALLLEEVHHTYINAAHDDKMVGEVGDKMAGEVGDKLVAEVGDKMAGKNGDEITKVDEDDGFPEMPILQKNEDCGYDDEEELAEEGFMLGADQDSVVFGGREVAAMSKVNEVFGDGGKEVEGFGDEVGMLKGDGLKVDEGVIGGYAATDGYKDDEKGVEDAKKDKKGANKGGRRGRRKNNWNKKKSKKNKSENNENNNSKVENALSKVIVEIEKESDVQSDNVGDEDAHSQIVGCRTLRKRKTSVNNNNNKVSIQNVANKNDCESLESGHNKPKLLGFSIENVLSCNNTNKLSNINIINSNKNNTNDDNSSKNNNGNGSFAISSDGNNNDDMNSVNNCMSNDGNNTASTFVVSEHSVGFSHFLSKPLPHSVIHKNNIPPPPPKFVRSFKEVNKEEEDDDLQNKNKQNKKIKEKLCSTSLHKEEDTTIATSPMVATYNPPCLPSTVINNKSRLFQEKSRKLSKICLKLQANSGALKVGALSPSLQHDLLREQEEKKKEEQQKVEEKVREKEREKDERLHKYMEENKEAVDRYIQDQTQLVKLRNKAYRLFCCLFPEIQLPLGMSPDSSAIETLLQHTINKLQQDDAVQDSTACVQVSIPQIHLNNDSTSNLNNFLKLLRTFLHLVLPHLQSYLSTSACLGIMEKIVDRVVMANCAFIGVTSHDDDDKSDVTDKNVKDTVQEQKKSGKMINSFVLLEDTANNKAEVAAL